MHLLSICLNTHLTLVDIFFKDNVSRPVIESALDISANHELYSHMNVTAEKHEVEATEPKEWVQDLH